MFKFSTSLHSSARSNYSNRLVDAQTQGMLEQDNGTNSCILGPFYVTDPPRYENGDTIIQKYLGGEVTYFHGRILDADNDQPVAGTLNWSFNIMS